jgi:hypothetical protein
MTAALMVGFLLCGVAPVRAADPAVDAALQAEAVNAEHCANLYSAQAKRAASSNLAIAEVWSHVTDVYEATTSPFLLYWRGVLAQCLGRDEAAVADLEAFVESQGTSAIYASSVQQAKSRLKKLGAGTKPGDGAASTFLRRAPSLEVAASWAGGSGVHALGCTDPDRPPEGPRVENSACIGSTQPVLDVAPAFSPAAVEASVDAFPLPAFGLGARVILDVAVPSGLPNLRSPGPVLQVGFGPQLRLLDSVASGGRAGWFRLEGHVAASFAHLSPMAGSAKYGSSTGYLDAGTIGLRHVGIAARIEGAIELGPRLLLLLAGRFAGYPPLPGSATGVIAEAGTATLEVGQGETRQEAVQIQPPVVSTAQLSAGGRVGLLVPHEAKAVAVGPFVSVDLRHAIVDYPNDAADGWCVGDCSQGDENRRKVYSSQRDDLYIRAGVELRFGAAGR